LIPQFGILIKIVIDAHVSVLLGIGSFQGLFQASDFLDLGVEITFELGELSLNSRSVAITAAVAHNFVEFDWLRRVLLFLLSTPTWLLGSLRVITIILAAIMTILAVIRIIGCVGG